MTARRRLYPLSSPPPPPPVVAIARFMTMTAADTQQLPTINKRVLRNAFYVISSYAVRVLGKFFRNNSPSPDWKRSIWTPERHETNGSSFVLRVRHRSSHSANTRKCQMQSKAFWNAFQVHFRRSIGKTRLTTGTSFVFTPKQQRYSLLSFGQSARRLDGKMLDKPTLDPTGINGKKFCGLSKLTILI